MSKVVTIAAVEERTTSGEMNKERKIQPELVETLGQLAESLRESLDEPAEDATAAVAADTVRIRKPPRVFTTVLGQNIWMGDVDHCELELEDANGSNPYDNAASNDPWERTQK